MDLDTVKAGLDGALRGVAVVTDEPLDVLLLHLSRLDIVVRDRSGTPRSLIRVSVGDTTSRPELRKDQPTLGVDGIDDWFPALNLGVGVDSGHLLHTARLLGDGRSLRDEETTGRRTLLVVVFGVGSGDRIRP